MIVYLQCYIHPKMILLLIRITNFSIVCCQKSRHASWLGLTRMVGMLPGWIFDWPEGVAEEPEDLGNLTRRMCSRRILAIKLLFICTTVTAWDENKGKTKGRTIISENFCCLALPKQTKPNLTPRETHKRGWGPSGFQQGLSSEDIPDVLARWNILWHIVVIFVFVCIKEAMYKTPLDLTDLLSLGGVGLAGPYLTPCVSFPITLTNPLNSKGQSAGTRTFFSLGITKSNLTEFV